MRTSKIMRCSDENIPIYNAHSNNSYNELEHSVNVCNGVSNENSSLFILKLASHIPTTAQL